MKNDTPPPPDRRTIAFHEAGHFVVLLAVGRGDFAKFVQVNDAADRDGVGGRSVADWVGLQTETRGERRDCVAVCLAGAEAERLHSGAPLLRVRIFGAIDDYETAYRMVEPIYEGLPDDQQRTFVEGEIEGTRQRAEKLVRRHWPAVQAIAEALVERGRLSGLEACGLAFGADPNLAAAAEAASHVVRTEVASRTGVDRGVGEPPDSRV